MIKFWKHNRLRKYAREVLRHARHHFNMQEDVLSEEQIAECNQFRDAVKSALVERDYDALDSAVTELAEAIVAIRPNCPHPGIRENLEVLVVAFALAMAFRAYMFQPFAIPTGSMKPTLFGIHSQPMSESRVWDKPLLKPLNWLVKGEWFRRIVVAEEGGSVAFALRDRSKPGYNRVVVGRESYFIPSDVLKRIRSLPESQIHPAERTLRRAFVKWVGHERGYDSLLQMNGGDLLWQGVRISGDHVFVNRLRWNFLSPKRGEIMVFSTEGLNLSGPHYIKRMCGLPGESVSVDPPFLKINGETVTEPESIARMTRQQITPDGQFAGFQLIGNHDASSPHPLRAVESAFPLGEEEFFAMGDNSNSSKDSRYWGAVPAENLVGPCHVVYWPFSRRWGIKAGELAPAKSAE